MAGRGEPPLPRGAGGCRGRWAGGGSWSGSVAARPLWVRNRRNMRNITGGGVADAILVAQQVRNRLGCCACVAVVGLRSATVLACGFTLLLRVLRRLRQVAAPGVEEVGALVAARS